VDGGNGDTMAKTTIKCISMSRHNGGAKAKRLYGSSTITQFAVWMEDENGAKVGNTEFFEVPGASPSARKAEAIQRFKEKSTVSVMAS
jgi:hypothetical protein